MREKSTAHDVEPFGSGAGMNWRKGSERERETTRERETATGPECTTHTQKPHTGTTGKRKRHPIPFKISVCVWVYERVCDYVSVCEEMKLNEFRKTACINYVAWPKVFDLSRQYKGWLNIFVDVVVVVCYSCFSECFLFWATQISFKRLI